MNYERQSRRNILAQALADKTNYLHWLILGWETEDPHLALQHFRKALALKPGDPVVLDSIEALREKHPAVASANAESYPITTDEEKPAATVAGNPQVPSHLQNNRQDQIITSRRGLLKFRPNLNLRIWENIAKHPGTPYILYLLGLTLAEFLTAMSSPQVGLVLHGLLLVALFIQAGFSRRKYQYRFYLVLALAPLVRLMSLSMPLLQFEFTNWYMIIGLPLLLAGLIAMRLSGYAPQQVGLGLGRQWWLQALVALTGLGWGYLEYWILEPEPLIDTLSWGQIWYPALILLVFTGFLEEFIFRGLMQRAALQGLEKWGMAFTAGVFAVLHIGYLSILDVVFVFGVGLFFSLIVHRTHSIWGVSLAHGLTNIALFLIVPFIAAPATPQPLASSLPVPLTAAPATMSGGISGKATGTTFAAAPLTTIQLAATISLSPAMGESPPIATITEAVAITRTAAIAITETPALPPEKLEILVSRLDNATREDPVSWHKIAFDAARRTLVASDR